MTDRLFKLRMHRNTYDKDDESCIDYMILQSGANGSSNYERIGWASFWIKLIDGTAFPEFLDGETEEVITII